MSGEREIRSKIHSVQNLQKITHAMQMVAAAKMRRAQERMQAARPYAEQIGRLAAHIGASYSEYRHPFLENRAGGNEAFIVITTDKGLCGGLNSGVLRLTLSLAKGLPNTERPLYALLGTRGLGVLHQADLNVFMHVNQFGENPTTDTVIGPVTALREAFFNGEINRLSIVSNKFINTMRQEPTVQVLLPLPPTPDDFPVSRWDYIYEPEPRELLDTILNRYLEAIVYGALVENIACEQSARMVAMRAAYDNAGEVIDELRLHYNKMRQASVTQELAEIVGGAAAVS
ncbi:MAG TPA: F0F1 ATP synthase subunit gamma [Acidiferrobacter sp.]|nr:F0F1 ATP synthase subunit gamma [Acidiferrobacter sp.]